MALYEVTSDNLTKIAQATFVQAGLRERTDLQRLLKNMQHFDFVETSS